MGNALTAAGGGGGGGGGGEATGDNLTDTLSGLQTIGTIAGDAIS